MAKKRKPTGVADNPATPQDESVTEVEVDDSEPLVEGEHIAVDVSGNGTYEIREVAPGDTGRERYVKIDGLTYEHVGEYRGVWAYRHLG